MEHRLRATKVKIEWLDSLCHMQTYWQREVIDKTNMYQIYHARNGVNCHMSKQTIFQMHFSMQTFFKKNQILNNGWKNVIHWNGLFLVFYFHLKRRQLILPIFDLSLDRPTFMNTYIMIICSYIIWMKKATTEAQSKSKIQSGTPYPNQPWPIRARRKTWVQSWK